jgi:Fe-S oxidoreductase
MRIGKPELEEQLYTCAQCGYCLDTCPIYHEIPWESASPRGKVYWIKRIRMRGLLSPRVELDENFAKRLFQCTLCGRCREVCQTMIDLVELWYTARAEVYRFGLHPGNLERLLENLLETRNPYGLDADMRLDWADYTGLEEVPVEEKAEIGYFVGCTTAFKRVDQDIAHAIGELLNHLGVDWTLLGEDEWCCGGPLLMIGDAERAEEFIRHNIGEVGKRGIRLLITGCPTCFRMWRFEIPKIIGRELSFQVEHCAQFFLRCLQHGEMEIPPSEERVTYHDPCELARLGGVIEEPRGILRAFSPAYVEMPEHGVETRCCGGGGLLQATNNELRLSIARRRLEQARATDVKVLLSACPACKITFTDALRDSGIQLEMLDIHEYLAQRLTLV